MVGIRLYQNLFAPNMARSDPVAALTGGIRVSGLMVNGQAVSVDSLAAAGAPPPWCGSGSPRRSRRTGVATLEASWSFEVPLIPDDKRGDRMGRWGTRLFQLAQWYPRVAMYDDLRGWDPDPYMGGSEFYNNFGSFDVRIDVPAGWLVGATGVLANPDQVLTPTVRQRLATATASDSQIVIVGADDRGAGKATAAGDRLVWHFTADSVADFAWATSNEFVWDATRATIPGRGAIPVNLLYLPEHTRYANDRAVGPARARVLLDALDALRLAALHQVDGPEGGMEYPMLTMSGPGFGVTDHEIGHQWWPMMVGVNETWYGWMDEGFNSYMNILSRGPPSRSSPPCSTGWRQRYGRPRAARPRTR